MAMDIFSGANIQVQIGTAGSTEATDFVEVPEVASFTTSGAESTVITVKSFNSAYDRKLLGTKNVPDITLTVNYLPDDAVHQQLETAAENQSRIQVKLSYFTDATKTEGFSVTYNCFVSKSTIAGDKDQVITKDFTLGIDGGAVATAVITAGA
ncbi:phage tail tube protein [Mangrovibacter plantisponsor]|uniref:Tail tube protein n=1 Tax=Mangrovibacter plantisponsor TaxID=451513 RepID=A0A317PZ51_9ENTR|nr:phage tail tube protein [Mangrovibacter plantisponsor]PWW04981.1 tail tube protein [Mangrovibacter plantisponsor]